MNVTASLSGGLAPTLTRLKVTDRTSSVVFKGLELEEVVDLAFQEFFERWYYVPQGEEGRGDDGREGSH